MARVAFILDEDYEDSEMRVPYDRVKAAGHEATIVGLKRAKSLAGKKGKETFVTERAASEVSAGDFDALVIPGGYSPDKLRVSEEMVELVRDMCAAGKPVAAVCHAPSILIEADVVRGKTLTSWPSIRTDLRNAGARVVDREVVEDGNLITSRNPGDLEAFSAALLRQIEGRRGDQAGAQVGV